mmetsp:Transcript_32082/g.33332  ORF Transcript_32082/g.33332 Transcript_32082/m.33332 type:complete len:226 (-) Transcript_32082:33-710(-)
MGCNNSRTSYEITVSHFWTNLPAANITADTLVNEYKVKYKKSQEERLFNSVTQKYFYNNDYDVHSKKVVPDLWVNTQEEPSIVFLSLLLMTNSDSSFRQAFLDCLKIFGEESRIKEEEGKVYVEYAYFRKVLEFYVNAVSLSGVSRLSQTAQNAKEFQSFLGDCFKEEYQARFINKHTDNFLRDMTNGRMLKFDSWCKKSYGHFFHDEVRDKMVEYRNRDMEKKK